MIAIKTFVFNAFQVNSFVCSSSDKSCIIVDPGCNNSSEEKTLTQYITDSGLNPVAVITTHGHIDHIIGVDFCMQNWRIPWYIHADDLYLIKLAPASAEMFGFVMTKAPVPSGYLNIHESFWFGTDYFNFLHVPGHSPGSVALYDKVGHVIIAGDVLFAGSIGRSDLPGGNQDVLLSSIHHFLLPLPENTVVWPGHGPSTTIGIERTENPYLQ